MKKKKLVFETSFTCLKQELFSWHMAEGALERLIPPWMRVCIMKQGHPQKVGSETILQIRLGPFSYKWIARHTHYNLEGEFVDEAVKSPFLFFKHSHAMLEKTGGSILRDTIEFATPFYLSDRLVEKELRRLFAFRHARLKRDLSIVDRYPKDKKKVLLSGSSGLVGKELSSLLSSFGHTVYQLKRGKTSVEKGIIGWDPDQDRNEPKDFEGFDAVIHLAGENIGEKFWTKKQKGKIFLSRSRDTWLLAKILSRLSHPPKVFIGASAVGIYGDRKEEILTEESAPSDDFLANVCTHWERASEGLTEKGVRRCIARFGFIMTPKGGILLKMLTPFRLGLGGRLGTGTQWMPWVSLDDVIYSLYHLMMTDAAIGAYNICSPHPVQQKEFAKELSLALHRPAFFTVPSILLYLMGKQRARALILYSIRACSKKLIESGYSFSFSKLKDYFSECF